MSFENSNLWTWITTFSNSVEYLFDRTSYVLLEFDSITETLFFLRGHT